MAKQKNKRKKSRKTEKTEADFEEVTVTCASCGKKMKAIKIRGMSMEGMLCQSCGAGDISTDTG